MEISIDDFNSLSAELSRRDVKIATQEMELRAQAARHKVEMDAMRGSIDALLAENASLREQNDLLRTDFENLRFENHWMRQYILLSADKVQHFFSHIRDFALLSAIKSFVLDMLPTNATPEQIAYTHDVMQLPMPQEDKPHVVNVSGDYVLEKQVGNEVGRVEPGAVGFSVGKMGDDV